MQRDWRRGTHRGLRTEEGGLPWPRWAGCRDTKYLFFSSTTGEKEAAGGRVQPTVLSGFCNNLLDQIGHAASGRAWIVAAATRTWNLLPQPACAGCAGGVASASLSCRLAASSRKEMVGGMWWRDLAVFDGVRRYGPL